MAIEPLRLRRLRIEAAARTSQSPLYKWQNDNYDLIVSIIGASAQNWEPVRRMAVEAGIHDTKDREPTLRSMAKTWFKVRQSHTCSSTVEKKPKGQVEPHLNSRAGKVLPTNRRQPVSGAEKEPRDSRSKTVLVASTERKLAEVPRSEETNRTAADMTPEGSLARALRVMQERADRRVGIFRENDSE